MTITTLHLAALLPLLITGLTVVVLLLSIAWRRSQGQTAAITLIGLIVALVSLCYVNQITPVQVTLLMKVDGFSMFYSALTLIVSIVVCIFASNWLKTYPDNKDEFYLLLVIATIGGLTLSNADHLATLFIGIELLSLPMFGLIGYAYRRGRGIEASTKYMILSAAASAFLLFGIALLYAATGKLTFAGVADGFNVSSPLYPVMLIGVGMLVIGLAFKLSLAPFQLWTPDVYQGAPTPVSMFLASVGKIAVFAVLTRFIFTTSAFDSNQVYFILAFIAFISILFGNIVAITQTNVKRMLAYSSIGHIGYLLVAVIGLRFEQLSLEGIAIYFVGYLLSTIVTFGVVCVHSGTYQQHDKEHFSDYRGLFWRNPVMAICMLVALLSLAGIPFTLGFIGKFYVIAISVNVGLWWQVAAVVIGSALGLYFYLRLAINLFYRVDMTNESVSCGVDGGCKCCACLQKWIIAICTVLLVVFGIFPQPLIDLVQCVHFVLSM